MMGYHFKKIYLLFAAAPEPKGQLTLNLVGSIKVRAPENRKIAGLDRK